MKANKIYSLITLLISSCDQKVGHDYDYGALEKHTMECAPPATMEVKPWGKNGLSKGCGIKSGEFVAAEDGYIHLHGKYENGIKSGTWNWYDRNGKVVKIINYSDESIP